MNNLPPGVMPQGPRELSPDQEQDNIIKFYSDSMNSIVFPKDQIIAPRLEAALTEAKEFFKMRLMKELSNTTSTDTTSPQLKLCCKETNGECTDNLSSCS